MARIKNNNRTKRVRNKKGRKTKRRTRRTRRNRQRGGKSFKEHISSARNKIRGSFQKIRERFTGNKNKPVSSQDEIKRLRAQSRQNNIDGISDESLIPKMRRNVNGRTEQLGKVNEGIQKMRNQSSIFLASAKKLREEREQREHMS